MLQVNVENPIVIWVNTNEDIIEFFFYRNFERSLLKQLSVCRDFRRVFFWNNFFSHPLPFPLLLPLSPLFSLPFSLFHSIFLWILIHIYMYIFYSWIHQHRNFGFRFKLRGFDKRFSSLREFHCSKLKYDLRGK